MGKPDTRKLDREIRATERKLEAVRERELWPLTGQERRAILRGVVGGSYRIARHRSTGRAESRIDTAWQSAENRIVTELAALRMERHRIVREAAADKAARKSSRWW
ncbi:hypothetical protein [Streptomyces sp. NPDC052610]|uniref:hypothetical protein n=1 Tax=Streptomyces sp. NPDC052610 TaxID=3154952 RepID=UPI003432A5C9